MEAKPFPKALYNKCLAAGIEVVELSFSGGDDNGYLSIHMEGGNYDAELESEIDDWAWKVYSYSGAGDGNDYGDNIRYDLLNAKITTQSWYTTQEYESEEEFTLEVE